MKKTVLKDDNGKSIDEALPSTPVSVLGLAAIHSPLMSFGKYFLFCYLNHFFGQNYHYHLFHY